MFSIWGICDPATEKWHINKEKAGKPQEGEEAQWCNMNKL